MHTRNSFQVGQWRCNVGMSPTTYTTFDGIEVIFHPDTWTTYIQARRPHVTNPELVQALPQPVRIYADTSSAVRPPFLDLLQRMLKMIRTVEAIIDEHG